MPYPRSGHTSAIDRAHIRESPPVRDRCPYHWAMPPRRCHSIQCKEVLYTARRFYTVEGGPILYSARRFYTVQGGAILYTARRFYTAQGGSIHCKEVPFYTVYSPCVLPGPKIWGGTCFRASMTSPPMLLIAKKLSGTEKIFSNNHCSIFILPYKKNGFINTVINSQLITDSRFFFFQMTVKCQPQKAEDCDTLNVAHGSGANSAAAQFCWLCWF